MPLIKDFKKYLVAIALTLLYVIVDMVFTLKGIYYFNILPLMLFLIVIAFIRLDYLFFIIIICTPLSVPLIEYIPSSPIDFAIPTEPLIFGVMLIVIIKLIHEKSFDLKILNHPVTYVIIFHLFWIFMTSVTSTMPLVSFKFLLARFWFIITFYFLAIHIFRKKENISAYIWAYSIPMMIVILYSINRHLEYGLFDKEASHFVMGPFFRDHTSYGAISAMLFFALGSTILFQKKNTITQMCFWIGLFIITSGLILSYARAAWVSVIFSFLIMFIVLFKIKFKYLALFGLFILIYLGGKRVEIIHKMEGNKQESSASLAEHVQSISNIKSDNSNIERINRWTSALLMFEERPLFGWGPGTYMFKYAPFQLSKNRTYISTDFGNRGNAHSEYIGPLAEQGFLGTISFMLIAIFGLITGFKAYRNVPDKHIKNIVLGLILGLITYLVHGIMNNFLDTDKASALFWGFIAVFVAVDIYHKPRQENQENLI